MWSELRNHLLRNPVYKVTAVITAIFAWVYVQGGEVMDTSIQVRVEWKLPDQFAPVSPPIEIAAAKIRGTRSATRRARRRAPHLSMDASSLGPGLHEIRLRDLAVENLGPGVELVELSPGVVELDLDEIATRKVAVKPVRVGSPPPDVEVALEVMEPVLEVQGPRRLVEPLVEVSTQPIDVSTLSNPQTLRVGLTLPRQVGLVTGTGDDLTEVRVSVSPSMVERAFPLTRVLFWGEGAATIEPQVIEITLRGDTAILEGLAAEEVVVIAHGPAGGLKDAVSIGFNETSSGQLRVLHPAPSSLSVISASPDRVTLTP